MAQKETPKVGELNLTWLAKNLVPIKFYVYTTYVQNRILEVEDSTLNNAFLDFCYKMKEKAILAGARWDNKVAIELQIPYGNKVEDQVSGKIFLGYCDNIWSLGLSIWCPDYKMRGYNASVIELKEEKFILGLQADEISIDPTALLYWYKTTSFNVEGNSSEDCVKEYLKTI